MDEAELRGQLLKTTYDLRRNAGGWVPTSDMNFRDSAVDREAIALTGQHLADAGLIEWKPLRGGAEGFVGMARITGHGVDVVEKRTAASIHIMLPGADAAPPPRSGNASVEPPYVPDNQTWETAAQIAVDARRRANAAILEAGTGTVLPPLSAEAQQSAASLSGEGRLAANAGVLPATVPITPTHYPADPGGTIIVHNHIVINIHTADFKEFNAKLESLFPKIGQANEYSVEVREQLVAELKAGKEIMNAPKPDRNYIELLLARPLRYLADKGGSAVISKIAVALLELLGKITGLW